MAKKDLIEHYRLVAQNAGVRRNTAEALQWFRELFRSSRPRINVIEDISLSFRNRKVEVGSLITYRYSPKYKNKLPYYDEFPLVLVTEFHRNGWTGINVHYLEPKLRAELFGELSYANKNRLRIVEQITKHPYYSASIKRYVVSNINSKHLNIPREHWDMVIMLPFSKFTGASNRKIWNDTRRKLK